MEFIQTRGYVPHSENINKETNKYDYPNKALLELYNEVDAEKTYQLLLIDTDSTWKQRLEAIGVLLASMGIETSLTIPEYNGKITKQEIGIKQANAVRMLGMFVGYFFNCTSWKSGTLQEYDSIELKKRLDRIAGCL